MRLKLIMIGLAVVLALSLMACSSPSPGNVSWEVPIDNFMEQQHVSDQIEVPAGDTLTLTLGSNPTTGFLWSEEAQISDTNVLKQVSHDYKAPGSEMVGAAGQEIWKFEALKEGTSIVSMEYSRPWEGGEKGEWIYKLAVTVK